MKNKLSVNISSALGFIVIGLLFGWLFFSGGEKETTQITDEHNHESIEEVWTCSMHPQIRQKEPGKCPICGMDLIILDENGEDSPTRFVMTQNAVKLAQIETLTIGDGSIQKNTDAKEIYLTGKVKMNEQNSGTQTAHIGGRIEQLFVSYTGERVQKGQKLAKIYSPELVAAQKELLEAIKLKEEMPSLYQAAREKIKLWKLAESTIDEIEQSGKVQTEVILYADMSGVVMKKYVEEGDHVKQGSPLLDMMDLNSVWVLFDVYEKDLQWVKKGELVEFNLAAMPEQTFKAHITFIDPIINPVTRVASARVEILNRKGRIKPDMFAKGIVKVKASKKSLKGGILTVPKSAVMWTGKYSVVYVQVPNMDVPTYEFREVAIGTDLGAYYIIESGLNNGDEVVVNGAFRLDAAAQLSNKASMMNRHILVQGQKEKVPDFRTVSPKAFKKQLLAFINSYLKLKDYLVASDQEAAQNSIDLLEKQFRQIDMKLVQGDAHIYWMQKAKGFEIHLSDIRKAKDIKEQRKQFSYLSELLIQVIKAFGVEEGTYYLQHCPMALEDEGANWLSRESQILNPYFGDKMLTCGITKDSITSL